MTKISQMPSKTELLDWFKKNGKNAVLDVNAHIHTPYSFSAFENIPQTFNMAAEEGVSVLGINDFYTMDGYAEFNEQAEKSSVFPLFNIEFIGLNQEDQKNGIRVNDPNNPGRTYFSGKGLAFPVKLEEPYASQLSSVKAETLKQVEEMVAKTNGILKEMGEDFSLSMEEIFEKYAVDQVRERHIAKVIRIKAYDKYTSVEDRKAFFKKLYGGKDSSVDFSDINAIENEIRGALLKAGGRAFVEEDPKAFLDVTDVKTIILKAGGIPTYPLLADNKDGGYTDFEEDKEKLLAVLNERGIYSIEFIPGRNGLQLLKEYAEFFWSNKIVVTFGTEHNTPALIPVKIDTRGGVDLDDDLKAINYAGACVTAAHQYLVSKGEEGYVDSNGVAKQDKLDEFVALGKAVIEHYLVN